MDSNRFTIGYPENGGTGTRKALGRGGHTHTDIFGNSESLKETPQKQQSTQQSSNASCIQNILIGDQQKEVEDNKEEKEKVPKENKTETNEPVATFQRIRMPPGGHSAGFW